MFRTPQFIEQTSQNSIRQAFKPQKATESSTSERRIRRAMAKLNQQKKNDTDQLTQSTVFSFLCERVSQAHSFDLGGLRLMVFCFCVL